MTLLEHLAELRTRLVRSVSALFVGAVVGYVVYDPVFEFLLDPYCQVDAAFRPEGGDCALVALRPLEPFTVRIKVALVVGLLIAGPVIFYQLWRFITPGLTRRERRHALPFVISSQVMFAAGMAFAYYVIPKGLAVVLGLGGDRVAILLSAQEYLSFLLTALVAFGVVFETPLVLIFLSLIGAVKSAQLRSFRRYALIVNLIVAAIVTPTTDAITMLFLAGPMVLLYEVSILAARLIERSRRKRQTQ